MPQAENPGRFSAFVSWCRTYITFTGLLVISVVVYMIFFQENSMSKIYAYDHTIDSLRTQIKINEDSMRLYQSLNDRLDAGDPEIIERVVRENHGMNMPDEDVYIFN